MWDASAAAVGVAGRFFFFSAIHAESTRLPRANFIFVFYAACLPCRIFSE